MTENRRIINKTTKREIYDDKNILLVMLDNTRFKIICNRYST